MKKTFSQRIDELAKTKEFTNCNNGNCDELVNSNNNLSKYLFLMDTRNNVQNLCKAFNKNNIDNFTAVMCAQYNSEYIKNIAKTIDKSKELSEKEISKHFDISTRYAFYHIDNQSFVLMLMKKPEMIRNLYNSAIDITNENISAPSLDSDHIERDGF